MNDEPQRVPHSSIAPFALRLQPDVKAALERAAQREGRSLNAEIAARLEQSLWGETSVEERVARLEEELKKIWEMLSPTPPKVQFSGLRRRLAEQRLREFRDKHGYSEEDLPNPLDAGVDDESFYDFVMSHIEAMPHEEQSAAKGDLEALIRALYR